MADPFAEWPPEHYETPTEREERDMPDTTSLVDQIIAFEQGELDLDGTLDLFSTLIVSGAVWQLQGFYGRTARDLIEEGWLTETGERTDTEIDF